jgi:nucleoside-diphosphate-sugar epimerase
VKALITGGTGFLGSALAHRLHGPGWDVTVLGRNVAALKQFEAQGIKAFHANLEDEKAILNACKGQEIVFHAGALSSLWGDPKDFYRANVTGTENVIRGCMEHKVDRLIHVSTPSIYFRYEPRLNVREDAELPKPANEYSRAKLLAEHKIDEAHVQGLPVITIRPRAIFGPGDTSIFPRIIQRLGTGRMRVVGDGKNITDLTYIDNVVDALLLCAESPKETLGRKYNITNDEPVQLWEMIRRACTELGIPYPTRSISFKAAYAVGGILEGIHHLLPWRYEPFLTRYGVFVISQSATLDISAARRDLHYHPRISVDEGFQKFIEWWKNK